jgi:hypothetical protein
VVHIARKSSMVEEWHQVILLERRLLGQRPQNRKLSWFRVQARMVPVARELSRTEERRQEKICSFLRGECRK